MARYEQVESDLWNDEWLLSLTPEGKLLFLFLMTNPHLSVSGVYQLSVSTMAHHTGLTEAAIGKLLDQFALKEKIRYERGTLWLVNRWKHNRYGANQNSKIAAQRDLQKFMDRKFIREFMSRYGHTLQETTEPVGPVLPPKPVKVPRPKVKAVLAAPSHDLVKFFCHAYLAKFQEQYMPKFGRDGQALAAAKKVYGEEEVQQRILRYLDATDEFVKQAGYSLPLFVDRINQYGAVIAPKEVKTWTLDERKKQEAALDALAQH